MALSKGRIFLLCCLCSCVSLGFGLYLSEKLVYVGAILGIILLALGWKNKVGLTLGLISIIFSASVYWSHQKIPPDISPFYNHKVKMKITIQTDPYSGEKAQTFLAELREIEGQANGSRVSVSMPLFPRFEFGQELHLEGKLTEPSEFSTKDNVSGHLINPKVLDSENNSKGIKKLLYQLKDKLLITVRSMLPEPQAGLLAGLLLGERSMPKSYMDMFRLTGTTHIIAVSGFNITIVANFLDRMLRGLGRSTSFYGFVLGITAFVVITGASASVVRAGIMGSMVLLAQQAGRLYGSVNALLFSAAIMLVQNPKLLLFDIGFQLSFSALMGLLFVQPKLEQLSSSSFLKNSLFPTVAAQITTTPIILYHFGNFSTISVLTNLLVLPLISVTMLIGFVAVLFALIPSPFSLVTTSVAWICLKYIVVVVEWCAKVPYAGLSNLTFPLWAAVIYYAVLIILLKWKRKQKILSNI